MRTIAFHGIFRLLLGNRNVRWLWHSWDASGLLGLPTVVCEGNAGPRVSAQGSRDARRPNSTIAHAVTREPRDNRQRGGVGGLSYDNGCDENVLSVYVLNLD